MTTAPEAEFDPGSFRDPAGRIFLWNDRVFRTISDSSAPDYEFARDQGLLADLADRGMLLTAAEREIGEVPLPSQFDYRPRYLVEHPRLDFISYPYEWSFRGLRAAALLHLDLHLELLARGATLSDASAYNVQFRGASPVVIDLLSIRRYQEGEFWAGYRQFCEQFLNPLLLDAFLRVPFQPWYRGSLEGIPTIELAKLLPATRRFGARTLTHVILHAALERRSIRRAPKIGNARFPKRSYVGMLTQLRGWISRLNSGTTSGTTWADYSVDNSYATEDKVAKASMVRDFAASVRPRLLWDLGCNTGEYSEVALGAGAESVVGFDADHGALDQCFLRSASRGLRLQPVLMNLANPSPDQGWAQVERSGLARRAKPDAMLALALVHHLAIGRNVPLPDVLRWLVSLAPNIMVEYVPKDDPMIERMLQNRADIFPDYREDAFRSLLGRLGRIVSERAVSGSGRILFWVERAA